MDSYIDQELKKYDKQQYINIDGTFTNVQSVHDICEYLKAIFIKQAKENERLKEENEKLKSGIWKEEKMAELKDRYNKMEADYYRGFPITEEEKEKINKFINDKTTVKTKFGLGLHYEFTQTSLGTIGEVVTKLGERFIFRELD